jgi:hypothetical protein
MQTWEYKFVTCDSPVYQVEGWKRKPRWIDGQEIAGWKDGPWIYEYANQHGEEGWELVSVVINRADDGISDNPQYIFKRPIPKKAERIEYLSHLPD